MPRARNGTYERKSSRTWRHRDSIRESVISACSLVIDDYAIVPICLTFELLLESLADVDELSSTLVSYFFLFLLLLLSVCRRSLLLKYLWFVFLSHSCKQRRFRIDSSNADNLASFSNSLVVSRTIEWISCRTLIARLFLLVRWFVFIVYSVFVSYHRRYLYLTKLYLTTYELTNIIKQPDKCHRYRYPWLISRYCIIDDEFHIFIGRVRTDSDHSYRLQITRLYISMEIHIFLE